MFEEFHNLRPKIDTPEYQHALEVLYREIRSVSIDYGIMEKAQKRYILPSDFGWNDVGSWDEVYRLSEKDENKNTLSGHVFLRDVTGCHITTTPKRLVAAIGVDDLTIISTDDAVLVCKRGRSQDVKEIVDRLRKENLKKYL